MTTQLPVLQKPIGICASHITSEPTTLRMKQHSSTLSSGGYTITDAEGSSTLYTSDKKSSDWNSSRPLHDSNGIRLFDLDYDGNFWTIKLPDQEGDPVATIFRRGYSEGDYVGIRFIDSMTGRDVTLTVGAKFTAKRDAQCTTSKDVCVYYEDTLVAQTKMVNRKMARVPFKTNEWEVHVAQGMDSSLAVAIAIYFAIVLCEKPVMTKTELVLSVLLPSGVGAAGIGAMGAAGGGGGGGGGGDGGGGGGGGC